MPIPTSRLSIIALGTLAALVAQELARTANVSPSTIASVPESGKQDPAQPGGISSPKLTQPISRPETLAPQRLAAQRLAAQKPATTAQKQKQAVVESRKQLTTRNTPAKLTVTPVPNAGLLPIPPSPLTTQTARVRSVDVSQLPVDKFVAASLGQPAGQLAAAVTAPKATSAIAKPRIKQVALKQQAAARSTQLAMSDIQNHPARSAIAALVKQGVVQGLPDGTFRPDTPITDAEFDLLMQKAFGRGSQATYSIKRPTDVVTRADAAQFVFRQILRAETIAHKAGSSVANTLANAAGTNVQMAATSRTAPQTAKPEVRSAATISKPEIVAMETAGVKSLTEPSSNQTQKSPYQRSSLKPSELPPGLAAPSLSPDQEAYTLGPGDRFKVEVFGVPEYTRDYTVLVNRTVNLYLVGSLSVQGLTLKQTEDAIAARYAKLVKRNLIDVSLLSSRPLNLAIAGEVSRPGAYSVTVPEGGKFPTVTRLVQQAGGLTQSANPSLIQIRRPQQSGQDLIINVDLWELFKTGNIRQDIALRDGDMVFIPPATNVIPAEAAQLAAANFAADATQSLNIAIVGEVARPGSYVLSRSGGGGSSPTSAAAAGTTTGTASGSGSGLLTVTQAIQQAGGITQLADIRHVEVKRVTRSGPPQVIRLNLWDLVQSGDASQDLVLQQGDSIVIPVATAINPAEASLQGSASFAPSVIRVNVVGEVITPGPVQIPPNSTLNQALLAAGGFNKRARKRSVELIRLNPNGTVTRQEVSIDFSKGIDEKGNPLIRNNDIIVVKPTGLVKFSDTLDNVLTPLGRILPLFFLFN
jgi:polysaccharide export outer membrane protein